MRALSMTVVLAIVAAGAIALATGRLERVEIRSAREILAPLTGVADGIEINGPIRLSDHPRIEVVSGRLRFATPAESLIGPANAADTPDPLPELELVSPRFVMVPETASGAAGSSPVRDGHTSAWTERLLGEALAGLGYRSLRVRDGTVLMQGAIGRDVELSGLNGDFTIMPGRDRAIGTGAFAMLGETVRFDIGFGLGGRGVPDARGHRPVRFTLASDLFNATYDGDAGYRDGLSQEGRLRLGITDFHGLAARLGIPVPRERGWTAIAAEGQLSVQGGKLAISGAKLRIDNDEADGSLSFDLTHERPMLDGTLDFRSLGVLSEAPWTPMDALAAASLDVGRSLGLTSEETLAGPLAFLDRFDADLRISATSLRLGPIETGRTAASISVRAGRVSGEIAELALCGGTAVGRFGVDASLPIPKVSAAGSASEVSLDECLGSLIGAAVLTGSGDIAFDLSGSGAQIDAVLRTLAGTADLTLAGRGRLSGGPARALALAFGVQGETSGAVHPIDLEGLKARLSFAGGRMLLDDVAIGGAGQAVEVAGSASLDGKAIRLSIRTDGATDRTGSEGAAGRVIGGSWAAPQMLEPGGRASATSD
ncbi:MAG: AsmA-like C-terminal region-containing protein [Hyphomicrobiaceae bacterium]